MPLDLVRGRPRVSQTKSVPAPIGGLNYRDSAAAMPVTDALRMLNFVPLPYAVALRKGWMYWGGPYPGAVNTIVNHVIDRSSTGQHVIVASAGNLYVQIYGGDVPTLPYVTGTASQWQHSSLRNEAGVQFTVLVSAGTRPQIYQGTSGPSPTSTFTQMTESMVDPPVNFGEIFGIDPSKFMAVTNHKNRLWFIEVESANAWYMNLTLAVSGTVNKFPLGGIFDKGGTLQVICTWTVDAGRGMDDYIAFISTEGQVALYGGEIDDPDSWFLQGVYDIGAPVGLKAATKYGGEVLLITTDGLVPMTKALQSTRVNNAIALTDKIQHLVSDLITTSKEMIGWQTLIFPNQNQLWLITPAVQSLTDPTSAFKVRVLSMNTITGAWAEFDNMDIADVCLWSDTPLFGTSDGRIVLAWQGYLDKQEWGNIGGEYINAEVLTAYNYFSETALNKRWVFVRPIFQSGIVPPLSISISTDYALLESPAAVSVVPASATPYWDIAIWDLDRWPEDPQRYRRWISAMGIGYCAALNMRVRMGTQLLWTATDFVFEVGGVI